MVREFWTGKRFRVLFDDVVVGVEIVEHRRNIRVGPDFVVEGGGDLKLRAGNMVVFGNETTIEALGELTVGIDPALQQTLP